MSISFMEIYSNELNGNIKEIIVTANIKRNGINSEEIKEKTMTNLLKI